MNLANRISRIAIASLFLSLFIGAPAAIQTVSAAGPITKTVIVKDRNDQPLANAQVAFGYPADGQSFESWIWTEPVLTDSNGQVVISNLPQFPDAYVELYVQPQLSDIDNSLGFKESMSDSNVGFGSSSTINFRLAASTLKINLKTSTGAAVPVYSWVGFPEDSAMDMNTKWVYTNLLREGNFGINVDTTTAYQNNGEFEVSFGYQSSSNPGQSEQTSYVFSLNSSHVLSVKDRATQENTSKVGAVWQLTSLRANLKFKIVSPYDSSLTVKRTGLEVCKIVDNNELCFGGGGSIGLPDGSYRLKTYPGTSGFAASFYSATVSGGEVTSLKVGYPATSTNVQIDNGIAVFALGIPNLSGLITKPNGDTLTLTGNQGFSVQLMKDDGYGNYQHVEGTWSQGIYAFNISRVGSYRIEIQPQDLSDYASTRSQVITVTDSGGIKLSVNGDAASSSLVNNIKLATPSLKIRVREVDGSINLKNAGIEIRKDERFFTWVNTMNSGIAAINLDSPGNYQFIVNPIESTPNSTRKVYEAVATAGNNNEISVSISGVTPDANGLSTLYLGAAQIRGKVLQPTGTTGVANSWVVAVDKNTKNEMWQYGSNSSSDGSFAMSLPAGTYTLFARAPYGVATVGDSAPIGDLTVDGSGNVTIAGAAQSASMTADNFVIRLQVPFWSGKVLAPTGSDGVPNARVCLNSIVSGNQFWACANTNSQGQWAMGKPAGFNDFGSNDQLQIAENQNAKYSMATYQGKTAIESSGFLHTGASVDLRLKAPNFTIRTLYGSDTPTAASNMWVNLNAVSGGWLGGSSTDSNGYAKFYVSDLTKGVQVQIDPANNPAVSAVAASTMKKYLDGEMSSYVTSSSFSDTITLSVPNIRGIVTDSGTVAPNSWVELIDSSTNEWKGGSNTNRDGYFALNAANGQYTLRVNPPWNSSTTATNHSYSVTISGGNVSTFIDKVTEGAVVTTPYGSGSAYSLTLGTPSVIGKVTDPTNQEVQNSWVTPTNTETGNQLWQIGANSRSDGSFSMAVPDGLYSISANAPWNNSEYSSSAGCSVTISNGAITTSAGGCVLSNKQLNLQLRAPNLRVQVKDANGTALQNAHVGLGLGKWNVHAQTDSSGYASLFIDPAAINSINNGKITGAQNLWMWIDPPYGSSDSVRVQCSSGQANTACSTLATVTPGNSTFSDAQFIAVLPAPNTSVFVKLPNGTSAGANAWVTLEKILKNGSQQEIGRQWLAGSNTDSNGKATFNITDTNVAYAVRIEAPWNQRDLYAGAIYDTSTGVIGLNWAQVNAQNFALTSPNLTLAAKISDGSAAMSNGWIGVQKVNGSNVYMRWIGGYGLDQNGKVSVKLDANDRFKITLNPGYGINGVATDCIVTTDSDGVVSIVAGQCGTGTLASTTITLPIATGNVTGVVSGPGSVKVVGAIVRATINGSPESEEDPITSTDKNGVYNLQLDASQRWDIKIVPVNIGTDSVRLQSKTESNKTINGSGQTTISISLEAIG